MASPIINGHGVQASCCSGARHVPVSCLAHFIMLLLVFDFAPHTAILHLMSAF